MTGAEDGGSGIVTVVSGPPIPPEGPGLGMSMGREQQG